MGILDVIVGPIADLAGKFIKDPNKVMEFQLEVQKLADEEGKRIHEETLAQIEVNKTEASSGSVFVAGWRPFIGWSSGCAFIYSTMVYPTLQYFGGAGPHLDDAMVQSVLLGMLGIGAMRTVEKIKGVSTNDYRDLPKAPVTAAPTPPSPEQPASQSKPKKHFHIF